MRIYFCMSVVRTVGWSNVCGNWKCFFGSLPSMGLILCTGRSYTRFCGDWKCYGIDILGAGGIRPGFCGSLLIPTIRGRR